MEERKVLKLTNKDGKETEYEIIMAFYWLKTKKNYIIYTDNTVDDNGSLNVFASIYYPEDDSRLDTIETNEEWAEIEKRLDSITDVSKGD